MLAGIMSASTACNAPAQRARLARGNDDLRTKNAELERAVTQRDERIAALTRQIDALQSFEADRPAAAFAPVRIEIASLSGGTNFDETPGDDGVTVHLRLYDADGDAVKVPGRVRMQATQSQGDSSPQILAQCEFNKLEELRAAWHGRFGTSHYTFRCPFEKGMSSAGPTVDVRVEFTDYQTGTTLTALKQISITPQSPR